MNLRVLWITDPEGAALGPMLTLAPRWPAGAWALVRRPGTSARELGADARRLRDAGVPTLVSGRVDVAAALGLGVHLPERGLPADVARALLGPDVLVGVSRHDAEGLARAATEGADYATLSPFAATPGKGAPLGAEAFATLARRAPLPVIALGGIDRTNAAEALRAGASGVAMIRAADPALVVALCAR